MFSQYEEEKIIADFFEGCDPQNMTFLDIGANDGITFSNTHRLALNGWCGICLDPSPSAFEKLQNLYKDSTKVECFNFGISNQTGELELNESLNWIDNENTPIGILSCIDPNEKNRFYGMNWRTVKSRFLKFDLFYSTQIHKNFDFINIDCEGHDYVVLSQINLDLTCTKMVCIEFTSDEQIKNYYEYFDKFNFIEYHRTKDNILFIKNK